MPSTRPRMFMHLAYEKAAQEYQRSLPPEHYMEATTQATQRMITLESLDQVRSHRPELQIFNELLVQYEIPGSAKPGQVVPDNMIVVHPEPIKAEGSYNIPLQPVKPFCVLEYVSKHNSRKDYEENMQKYEHELKVRYYLLFHPEDQDLRLYRHNKRKYITVKPNENDRLSIDELDLEVAILDGWVRFWYEGKLLPLAVEWQEELENERQGRIDELRLRKEAEQATLKEQRLRKEAQEQLARALEELAKLKEQRGKGS